MQALRRQYDGNRAQLGSQAIMLADAVVSLGWLIVRVCISYFRVHGPSIARKLREKGIKKYLRDLANPIIRGYSPVELSAQRSTDQDYSLSKARSSSMDEEEEYDAPPEHQIGFKTAIAGLVLSLAFCLVAVRFSFAGIINVGL